MNPPPIPPHSDLSGIGHMQRLPSTPERTHINHLVKTPVRRDLPPIPVGQKSFQQNNDVIPKIDSKEEMRQRELEEVRARVAQMEKTMRWWSDCTANWREKWSKVRNERNQAREENRSFKFKVTSLTNDNNALKKKLHEFELKCKRVSNADNKCDTRSFTSEHNIEEIELKISENEEKENLQERQSTDLSANQMKKVFEEVKEKLNKEYKEKQKLMEGFSALQRKHDKLAGQHTALMKLKDDNDEEISRLREWKEERVESMQSDLEEGMMADKEKISPQLFDLHQELERLKLENANEWVIRGKLESDKLNLEQENQRLQERLDRVSGELSKSRLVGTPNKGELSALVQEELNEKIKEINEMKGVQSKLKKQLQEKTSELEHSRSRAEHYELEVKKLRGRVEQLKRDLENAEDELLWQSGQQLIAMKKLQRTIEELEEKTQHSQHFQANRASLAAEEEEEVASTITNDV